ncbi:papilin isoform X1, putative [Babesia caballi]|uniref:Papilin isoform X1, putative n=1 Tax=Babesia caballi TaxID=5871 RepID=A0AAV4LQG3_BABCB|nr:papilin isoform X1, putative [Babesia caballi]
MESRGMFSMLKCCLLSIVIMYMGIIKADPEGAVTTAVGYDLPLSSDGKLVERVLYRLTSEASPGENVIRDIVNKSNILLLTAGASLQISHSSQFSDYLEVLKKCKDYYGYPNATSESSLWETLGNQITANEAQHISIQGSILQIEDPNFGGGTWGPSIDVARRKIAAREAVLTKIRSIETRRYLDWLIRSSGQETQWKMLKTLPLNDLNNRDMETLIEALTRMYVTSPIEPHGDESREEILAVIEEMPSNATKYEKWVEEQSAYVSHLATFLSETIVPTNEATVNGGSVGSYNHRVLKCQALWYELHMAIEEQAVLTHATSILKKIIKSLMSGAVESQNDLVLCRRALKLIQNSVRESRFWDYGAQNRFLAKLNHLRTWISELYGTDVILEPIDTSKGEVNGSLDQTAALKIGFLNLKYKISYLNREADRLIQTRIRIYECVHLLSDPDFLRTKELSEATPAIVNMTLVTARLIDKLLGTSASPLLHIVTRFLSDKDRFVNERKLKSITHVTRKLYATFDVIRALMLDFYGLTYSLDPALELRSRIPGNFFLIDEIDRQVRDVMEAAEDMEKYVEIKASVMADLAVGSDEFVASGVNGEVADEVKEAQEKFLRMKGDVERVLNAFADVELSLPLIAELRNLIDNIGESDDPRDHETILAEYFELRPAIQRALLFAASFESIVLLSREFNEAASKVRAMAWTKEPEVQEEFMGASLTHMKTRTSSGTPYSPVLATIEEKDESTNSGGAVTSGVPRMVSRDVAEKTEGARLTQSQPKTGKSMGYLTTSSGRDTADSGKECAVASKHKAPRNPPSANMTHSASKKPSQLTAPLPVLTPEAHQ